MSESTALLTEGLSKRYRLGVREGGLFSYQTLRDAIAAAPRRLLARATGGSAAEPTEIWALRDVSMQVDRGEVVGIIGRNGAGKSTLLKILSRITRPTTGRARLFGRVGSLLEVGTGFHPELTGRDNIYLNGAILGMRRSEIQRRFDEIVAFAGIGPFLDTPVKRYSSGMYVRLAFSVAAHLEPDILVIDEVLAVGDAEFQKKCLGKMHQVRDSGRTVLFVSHQMALVTRLCSRAILLDKGRIVADGPAPSVVSSYLTSESATSGHREWDPEAAPGSEHVRLRSVRLVDRTLRTVDTTDIRDAFGVELTFDVGESAVPLLPHIVLHNEHGVLFNAIDTDPRWRLAPQAGRHVSIAWIPGNLMSEGLLTVTPGVVSLAPGRTVRHAWVPDAVAIQVVDSRGGQSARGDFAGVWGGAIRPMLVWAHAVNPGS